MLKLLENQDSILNILKSLPSESVFVDYKEVYDENSLPPCKNDITKSKKQLDFIKDIIAFLNSNSEICDDRFIIYGVSEDKEKGGYSITGLNSIKFPDDANLQPVFELIYPRPIIHTGTVSFRNKKIGYIHIDKVNTDFPYEAVGINSLNKEAIFQGQSWIRKGSKKEEFFGELRRKLIEKNLNNKHKQIVYNLDTDYELRKTITRLSVIGEWSEDRDEDRNIIAEICEKEYDKVKFIIDQNYPDLLNIENDGKYSGEKSINAVTSRDTYLSQLSIETFSNISDLILDILKYNKYKGATLTLCDGIGYTLAFLCDKKEFKKALSNIISEITKDERLTQKAEHILPYLVEVSQDRIFSYIEKRIEPRNYNQIAALRTLAWYDDYFVQAVLLLHRIKYSHLPELFIPSNVTTEAKTETKIAALRSLYSENGENNIDIVMKVISLAIPLRITYSPSHKPLKFGKPQNDTINISYSEIRAFFDYALQLSYENIEIITELLTRCVYYPIGFLLSIISHLNEFDIAKLAEKQKFELWNKLCILPVYTKNNDKIDEKHLDELRQAGERFKPIDGDKRKWFENDAFDLFTDDESSGSDVIEKLLKQQIETIKSIHKEKGINGVIEFLDSISKDIWNIGSVIEALDLSIDDNNILISQFSKSDKIKNTVQLYLRSISYHKDANWITNLKLPDDLDQKAEILSCFYIKNFQVIEYFTKLLNNDDDILWKHKTNINTNNYEVYKYAIRRFMKFEKYTSVIHNLTMLLHSKNLKDDIESDFIYEILYAFPNEEESVDEYLLFTALEVLHDKKHDEDMTISIEIKYCNEMSFFHYPIKASCFSKKCIAEPIYFINFLKNIDTVFYWDKVYIFDCFTAEISNPNEWISAIYNLINDETDDFKNLVYYCVGKIFNQQISYDKESILQIPDEIAKILEQNINILKNFSVNLFNSQGAYFADDAESIANKFKTVAKEQLNKGRNNLYLSLLNISKDYYSED